MTPFEIIVKSGYRNYRLRVEHMPIDTRTERFKVIGKNKNITLETNRPFFRNRGLKHRKPEWMIVEGQLFQGNGLEQIIDKIMAVIDKPV